MSSPLKQWYIDRRNEQRTRTDSVTPIPTFLWCPYFRIQNESSEDLYIECFRDSSHLEVTEFRVDARMTGGGFGFSRGRVSSGDATHKKHIGIGECKKFFPVTPITFIEAHVPRNGTDFHLGRCTLLKGQKWIITNIPQDLRKVDSKKDITTTAKNNSISNQDMVTIDNRGVIINDVDFKPTTLFAPLLNELDHLAKAYGNDATTLVIRYDVAMQNIKLETDTPKVRKSRDELVRDSENDDCNNHGNDSGGTFVVVDIKEDELESDGDFRRSRGFSDCTRLVYSESSNASIDICARSLTTSDVFKSICFKPSSASLSRRSPEKSSMKLAASSCSSSARFQDNEALDHFNEVETEFAISNKPFRIQSSGKTVLFDKIYNDQKEDENKGSHSLSVSSQHTSFTPSAGTEAKNNTIDTSNRKRSKSTSDIFKSLIGLKKPVSSASLAGSPEKESLKSFNNTLSCGNVALDQIKEVSETATISTKLPESLFSCKRLSFGEIYNKDESKILDREYSEEEVFVTQSELKSTTNLDAGTRSVSNSNVFKAMYFKPSSMSLSHRLSDQQQVYELSLERNSQETFESIDNTLVLPVGIAAADIFDSSSDELLEASCGNDDTTGSYNTPIKVDDNSVTASDRSEISDSTRSFSTSSSISPQSSPRSTEPIEEEPLNSTFSM